MTELTVTVTVEAEEEPEPEPEPDYSVSVSDVSVQPSEDAPEYISATVTLGVDVAYAVVAVVTSTEYDPSTVTGEEVTESGTVTLSLPDEDGTYYVVAVSYDSEDAVQESAISDAFTYTAPEEEGPDFEVPEGWTYLGMAEYTDVVVGYILSRGESYAVQTYEVPILESESTPGLFRLVNPYSEKYYTKASPCYGEFSSSGTDYYFEINATVYDEVYFEKQNTGAKVYYTQYDGKEAWNGSQDGDCIWIESLASYYVNKDGSDYTTEKGWGECGTYDEATGVITVPNVEGTGSANFVYYFGSEEETTTSNNVMKPQSDLKITLPGYY